MFSSAQTKNHFCELLDAARLSPVVVIEYDKPFVVLMAVEKYDRLSSENLPGGYRERVTSAPSAT
jgi:hypothetical protein